MMDPALVGSVLTQNLLLLSLGVAALVYCVRTITERLWAGADQNKWWADLALPLIPILIGFLLGLPLHQWLAGIVAGFISASVYRAVKAALGASNG